ncbi:unnamed protein product [Alopecurus aequalis]
MAMPALVDDLMREIFLRVRPDEPGDLIRVAAGCRTWRGMISNAAFAREYRDRHGAPPMLGFLYERSYTDGDEDYWVSHFVHATSFRSPACEDRPHWRVLDSRHGLVLFHTPGLNFDFVVSDLVTGVEWGIRANPECEKIMWWEAEGDDDSDDEEDNESMRCNAVVLCANDGCNHLYCHGGPFRVALVGSVQDGLVVHASVFSSETGEWSHMISGHSSNYINGRGHSAVVGNRVYVPCFEDDSVVEYNMGEQELSVIDCPFEEQDQNQPYIRLMGVEDGMLLFASVVKPRLYLWSMEASPSGTAGWARRRVIELEPLLPHDVLSDMSDVSAVGFAEGVRVIFVRTRNGLYTIDLNSGNGEMVHWNGIEKIMPYMSFYTGAWGQLPTPH